MLTALDQAETLGHVMHPALPYGADARWACARCSLAVVHHGPNWYGAALERPCRWTDDQIDRAGRAA